MMPIIILGVSSLFFAIFYLGYRIITARKPDSFLIFVLIAMSVFFSIIFFRTLIWPAFVSLTAHWP